MSAMIAFNPVYLPRNQGHGNARKEALNQCCYNLVAMMDADDICALHRFQKQLEFFQLHPDTDVAGGTITEFIDTPDNITGERTVELTDEKIKMDLRKRCPMNHMTVMYKKDAVQTSGGYLDWFCNEDYYLWIRMAEHGCKFANLPYPLVNVRVGKNMSARRGGWKYFRSEQLLQKYMLDHKLISIPRYFYNVAIRFGGEVMASGSVRNLLYKAVRKKYDPGKKHFTDIQQKKTETEYPPFSVAMSVYKNDNPEWFDTALASIIHQTVPPSEIVLVVDGPVSDEIQTVIDKYVKICQRGGGRLLKVIRFSENKGLGKALSVAVNHCSYELIARMDSDDIAVKNRFELQLKKFVSENIDICGGQIEEFIGEPANVTGKRIVPESDKELKVYMKKRCPFNHMTVMYKKSSVLDAGNYMDWFWNEDYYLWIRMALKNQRFANIPEVLVSVRIGKDMYARRGGDKYFKSEVRLQKFMLEKGIISRATYWSNCIKRFVVQQMMPVSLRAWVFRLFARK